MIARLLDLLEKGEAYQDNRPVMWDVDFQTAIAQAITREGQICAAPVALELFAPSVFPDVQADKLPGTALPANMKTIMEAAYYGTSFAEVRAHRADVKATADDAAEAVVAPAATTTAGARRRR